MMLGTPGKRKPKVARSICCSLIETLVLTVGRRAASKRMRSTRALTVELSRVSNPRLVFMPRAMASSRDRFNGVGVASPVGVLPLNCANSGKNVLENTITALKTVNLCLILNNVVDDFARHQAGGGERRALPMHPLKQGASLVIDERHVLKIHQNFAGRVIDPCLSPAIFQFGDPAFGQATADF